ncbi:hypothetical protein [Rubritalea marina]|uniref:hypothetical protein n=1 Tax=Rubritalea marina TaxID=361055 RepID=UPI0003612877|nr:hypothetical protein [Rubritalea marina]
MIITLQGMTDEDKDVVRSSTLQALERAGATLIDSKEFSEIAMNYMMEIPANHFGRLRTELSALDIVLYPPGSLEFRVGQDKDCGPVRAKLNLTFKQKEVEQDRELMGSC